MGKTKGLAGCSIKFADKLPRTFISKLSLMEPLRQFSQFLNKFIVLSEPEFDRIIAPYIQLRQFNKKQIVTKAGEVEEYMNFISKGLVRKYFLKDHDEIITQISLEGQIIHSQESFHTQTPSEYYIETMEQTTLVSISYTDLNAIYSAGAMMERMGRLIVTFVMVLNDRWQMSLLKLTPRERFLAFVQQNPQLMQRAPQKFLASLLNIQPETFSRFKHLVR
jgi:CRP-like cAMP-binding protein